MSRSKYVSVGGTGGLILDSKYDDFATNAGLQSIKNEIVSVIEAGNISTVIAGSDVAVPVDLQYHDLTNPIPVSINKRLVDSIVYLDQIDPSTPPYAQTFFPGNTSITGALNNPQALVHNTQKMTLFVNNTTDKNISIQIITATGVGGSDAYAISEPLTSIPANTKKRYTSVDFPIFAEPFARLVIMISREEVTTGNLTIIAEVAR